MKKLFLCAVAVLCVAASIFGGYYFYLTNDLQETETQQAQLREKDVDTRDATDREIPFKQRGGALMDENGDIDPNGVRNALAQRDLYLAQHMPTDGFGDKGDGVPQIPDNWLPRGPQNMGGRTEAILLHPNFGGPSSQVGRYTMWAGGASGGVWISNNAGKDWVAVNGILQNFNVSCFALDPGAPNVDLPMTIYAGTGALDYHGGGVFKSIDGGINWERVTGTSLWKYVTGLAVAHDVNGGTVLLAAMESDLGSSPERGIMRYKRLANGQEIWDRVISASYGTSVGFDPNDPSKAVAAVCDRGSLADSDGKCKAFYSTDYGVNWSPSRLGNTATPNPSPTPGLFETARVEHPIYFFFRTLPSGATTIYAQNGQYQPGLPPQPSKISKSTDGGINFSTYNMVGVPEGINEGVHPLWVSPELNSAGSNLVITGGAHLFRSINPQLWEQIANGYVLDACGLLSVRACAT